jgi:hypothetical protein
MGKEGVCIQTPIIARFEVFKAVNIQIEVFWVVMPENPAATIFGVK